MTQHLAHLTQHSTHLTQHLAHLTQHSPHLTPPSILDSTPGTPCGVLNHAVALGVSSILPSTAHATMTHQTKPVRSWKITGWLAQFKWLQRNDTQITCTVCIAAKKVNIMTTGKVIPAKCVVDEGSLPGKATEKWCLFRILALLISEYIPVDEAYWNLFLICRSIADYLFAPAVMDNDIDHLEFEIRTFLAEFVKIFPNKLTPKFHFLLHYPTQIRKLGPLWQFSWNIDVCLRIAYTTVDNQVCNFRNIAYSLAKWHQLW